MHDPKHYASILKVNNYLLQNILIKQSTFCNNILLSNRVVM